jgi:hypothetical protein
VANKLNRYTLSSRFKFNYNKDGSLDFYIQKDSPGKDKESNWLPAPADNFDLMLRFYWPKGQLSTARGNHRPLSSRSKGNVRHWVRMSPRLKGGES